MKHLLQAWPWLLTAVALGGCGQSFGAAAMDDASTSAPSDGAAGGLGASFDATTLDDRGCPSESRCGDHCVDLRTDPANCGTCGRVCGATLGGQGACEKGECVVRCDAGHHLCDNRCVSSLDIETCGASCTPCAPEPDAVLSCDGTKCVYTCSPGHDDCDKKPDNGCEASLASASSCGACQVTCAGATPVCSASEVPPQCRSGCPPNTLRCPDNTCAVTASDPAHCGSSCMACQGVPNGNARCQMGTCSFDCNKGFHTCGVSCASDTSPASCGMSCQTCAQPVNATAVCSSGACEWSCNAGFVKAGMACTRACSPDSPCGGPDGAGGTCQIGSGCSIVRELLVPWPDLTAAFPGLGCASNSWPDLTIQCTDTANAYCNAHGWPAGFGVLEDNGMQAQITCVAKPIEFLKLPFATLTAASAACIATSTPAVYGEDCLLAANSYCAANGFAGGFGLIGANTTVGTVLCFPASVMATVKILPTDLQLGCDLSANTYLRTGRCLLTSHRKCLQAGYASGVGIYQTSPGTYVASCLKNL